MIALNTNGHERILPPVLLGSTEAAYCDVPEEQFILRYNYSWLETLLPCTYREQLSAKKLLVLKAILGASHLFSLLPTSKTNLMGQKCRQCNSTT